MAREKLAWTPLEIDAKSTIGQAYAAELAAVEKTDTMIKAAVAKLRGIDPSTVRVGRAFGRLSFAVDPTATARASAVKLG